MKINILYVKGILLLSVSCLLFACSMSKESNMVQNSEDFMTRQQLITELVKLDRTEREIRYRRKNHEELASLLYWLPGLSDTTIDRNDALGLIAQRRDYLNNIIQIKFSNRSLARFSNHSKNYAYSPKYRNIDRDIEMDVSLDNADELAMVEDYNTDNIHYEQYADEYIADYVDSYQEPKTQAREEVAYDNYDYDYEERQPQRQNEGRNYQNKLGREYAKNNKNRNYEDYAPRDQKALRQTRKLSGSRNPKDLTNDQPSLAAKYRDDWEEERYEG